MRLATKRATTRIHPSNWTPISWIFAGVALAIRIPLLGTLGLHLDEQTFLNVGHDVAAGHLPYLHAWDNKPPLLFFLVAPITMVAHHAIWVVRVFAAGFDIITSLIAKRAADVLFGETSSNWIVAVWCFAALTVRDGGGALMSETISLPFLVGGALLLCEDRPTLLRSFVAGLLLGAATMIRGTPIFVAAAAILVCWVEALIKRDRHGACAGLLVAVGEVFIIAIATLPYFIVGELDMFVRSALLAPLAYVQERGHSSMTSEIVSLATSKSIGGAMFFGLAGIVYCVVTHRMGIAKWRLAIMWIALFLGLSRGPEGAFYLITLMPFACIFAAPIFTRLFELSSRKLTQIALIAILLLPMPVAAFTTLKRGREPSPIVDTLAILSKSMGPNDTLYLTTDYLLYWLFERTPPHPIVTHAGNLFRPGMFRVLPFGMMTSADVMRAIVATEPTWIVMETPNRYGPDTEVGQVLQPVLASNYHLVSSPVGRLIYRLGNLRAD